MSKYVAGQWNAICDVCGFEFKSGQLRKDWRGLMVCDKDFETRHPSDLIRIRTKEQLPDWTRPEPEDVFINVCYIWGQSGYADLGTADCMQADNGNQPYQLLLNLRDNNA